MLLSRSEHFPGRGPPRRGSSPSAAGFHARPCPDGTCPDGARERRRACGHRGPVPSRQPGDGAAMAFSFPSDRLFCHPVNAKARSCHARLGPCGVPTDHAHLVTPLGTLYSGEQPRAACDVLPHFCYFRRCLNLHVEMPHKLPRGSGVSRRVREPSLTTDSVAGQGFRSPAKCPPNTLHQRDVSVPCAPLCSCYFSSALPGRRVGSPAGRFPRNRFLGTWATLAVFAGPACLLPWVLSGRASVHFPPACLFPSRGVWGS